MPTADDVTRAVTEESILCLEGCVEKINHCVAQLSDEQMWWRPQESMNSIGNLILHLTGNVRQWIVSGIGGAPDTRCRPDEFAEKGPIARDVLLSQLHEAVSAARDILSRAGADDLLARRRVQGFEVSGWGALLDSVPHFKGHTQEIICLTRMQLGGDYRFHWQPQTSEQGA